MKSSVPAKNSGYSIPKISVRSSLALLVVALLFRLLPIPLDGDLLKASAFWVLLVAYGVLFWATLIKRRG